ncbi:hypothetical protein VB714_02525 [Spirulina sp. 06S082]|nr:hypothetical protein [Spirulina sp. 06S082]MEA5467728.1 hypothetical protein [Spirulina sp. 06S082]
MRSRFFLIIPLHKHSYSPEKDAIFGKRSEVKDNRDRYANMEVSYLLQRIESYQGLAVLTTNLKTAIDRAFLRRIRFIITFPFPDTQHQGQVLPKIGMVLEKVNEESFYYAHKRG